MGVHKGSGGGSRGRIGWEGRRRRRMGWEGTWMGSR